MKLIKTVVFDIGRVLIGFDWKSYLYKLFAGRLSAEEIDIIAKATFRSDYWRFLDNGEMKILEAISKMKGLAPGYESYVTEIIDRLDECAERMEYAIPWITEMKARGLRVLYLSNYSELLVEKIIHALNFIPYMDGGVGSCEEKCAKPDEKIYHILFERYDLIPSECIFIDDREANIETAKKLGMNGVLFFNYEQAHGEVNKIIDTFNSYFELGDISYMHTVKELFDQIVHKYSDRVALVQIDGKNNSKEITYKELANRVECLREGMVTGGLSGSHIAVIGETSIEWITLYLVVVGGCGVLVPIDKNLDAETISKQINTADVDYVFCSDKCMAKLNESLPKCKSVKGVFRLSYDEMPKNTENVCSIQIDPDKTCLVLYTSGTTGANKGVMLTNRNIISMLYGSSKMIRFPKSSLSVLPIHHAYELHSHILFCFYFGTTLYINDDMKYFEKNIIRSGAEMTCMVPMMLEFMVRRLKKALRSNSTDKEEIKRSIFGNLKMIVSGGAPLKQETVDILDDIGIKVHNGYGMTECSPVLTFNPFGMIKRGSVGMVLPMIRMRVADKNTEGYGELQVLGDSVMKGYYKDQDATAEVFTEDGWFKTGDIGYIDEDNYVYIVGRKKNLIILSNGENVVPEKIEQQLYSAIPYIKECVVYAESDAPGLTAEMFLDSEFCERNGLKNTKQKKQFIQKDLNVFNTHMCRYKKIYNVVVRESEFDKNTVQKIQRLKNGEK